jgi:hypothetical protein
LCPVESECTTPILELICAEGKIRNICIVFSRDSNRLPSAYKSRILSVHDPARFYILHTLHLFVTLLGLLCPPFRTTGSPRPEPSGQDEAASGGKHQHGVLRSK